MIDAVIIAVLVLSLHNFSRLVRAISSTILSFFPSSTYSAYKASWTNLSSLKAELSSISAQDEFARWAKLSRSVQKAEAEFNERSKENAMVEAMRQLKLTIASKALYTIILSVLTYFYWNKEILANSNIICFADWNVKVYGMYWIFICITAWNKLVGDKS